MLTTQQNLLDAPTLGKFAQFRPGGAGNARERLPIARRFCDQEIAVKIRQTLQHRQRFASPIEHRSATIQHRLRAITGNRSHHIEQIPLRHSPDQIPHMLRHHALIQQTELIEQTFRVTHPPLGDLRHQGQRLGRHVDFFDRGNMRQMIHHRIEANAAIVKPLAARNNRR